MSSPITHTVCFPRNYSGKSLADCTADDSSRYALAHVLIAPIPGKEQGAKLGEYGAAYALATDCKIAAAVRVEATCPDAVLMPRDAIPTKRPKAPYRDKRAMLNGRWENTDGRLADIVNGRFPRLDEVSAPHAIGYRDTAAVRLNAELLANLQKALNSGSDQESITLFIPISAPKLGPVTDAEFGAALDAQANGEVKPDDGLPLGYARGLRPQNGKAIHVLGANGIGMIMPCDSGDRDTPFRAEANQFDKQFAEMSSAAKQAHAQAAGHYGPQA